MERQPDTIIINNETIIDFFKESGLNPEETFLTIIDLFKKVNTSYKKGNLEELIIQINENIKETRTATFNNLQSIKDHLQQTFQSIVEKLNFFKDETIIMFSNKLNEIQKQYVNDLKILLNENSNTNFDKIQHKIERENQIFEDRLKLFFNDFFPKNNEEQIKKTTTEIHKIIEQEIKPIQSQKINEEIIDKFTSNIETRFNDYFISNKFNNENVINIIKQNNEFMETRMSNLISQLFSKENAGCLEQFKKSLHEETETLLKNTINNDTIQVYFLSIERKLQQLDDIVHLNKSQTENMNSFQKKFEEHILSTENSTKKGAMSEAKLERVLNIMFSNSEIENTSKTAHSGDIILSRKNREPLLIENKNYDKDYNVPFDEVRKFFIDVREQQMDAIFLSQNSGIAQRDNFEIEILDNRYVCIYVHNCNYDEIKIKTAIDIIDHIRKIMNKTEEENQTENFSISQCSIDKIKNDYLNFLKEKNILVKNMRNGQIEQNAIMDRNIKELENLSLNQLKTFLCCYFPQIDTEKRTEGNECPYCGKMTKNEKALYAHKRRCPKKDVLVEKNDDIFIEIDNNK